MWFCAYPLMAFITYYYYHHNHNNNNMAHPHVANGGEGFQIWIVTANILNKQ
jgi:hypothetical protein